LWLLTVVTSYHRHRAAGACRAGPVHRAQQQVSERASSSRADYRRSPGRHARWAARRLPRRSHDHPRQQ